MTKRKFPDGPRQLPGKPPGRFVEVGQRIGRSVVIETDLRIPSRPGANRRRTHRAVRLLCECGNEFVCNINEVLGGSRTGCGCGIRKPRLDTPNGAARNAVLKNYQGGAKHRGLAWELTGEDFDRLTSQPCHYCGTPPSTVRSVGVVHQNGDFIYTGLDRKDNALGYTPDNTLPCCTFCNRAKWARSYDEFMAWIAQLTEYHWFRPELTPSSRFKRSA